MAEYEKLQTVTVEVDYSADSLPGQIQRTGSLVKTLDGKVQWLRERTNPISRSVPACDSVRAEEIFFTHHTRVLGEHNQILSDLIDALDSIISNLDL